MERKKRRKKKRRRKKKERKNVSLYLDKKLLQKEIHRVF